MVLGAVGTPRIFRPPIGWTKMTDPSLARCRVCVRTWGGWEVKGEARLILMSFSSSTQSLVFPVTISPSILRNMSNMMLHDSFVWDTSHILWDWHSKETYINELWRTMMNYNITNICHFLQVTVLPKPRNVLLLALGSAWSGGDGGRRSSFFHENDKGHEAIKKWVNMNKLL